MFRVTLLALRGLLAIGLMFGFYGIAVAVSSALLYITYASTVHFYRFSSSIAIFCVGGAGIILWSVLPRPDHFAAPGPDLQRSHQPELFQLLDSVSAAVGQDAPKNVYLTLDVNAWVGQRGGLMGLGGRRVMGLGLPLMQALTVDQLRGVLAHEFGHYYGGDTMLAPWIYNTRKGIDRTLERLEKRWLIRLPFLVYAVLFVRITNKISRQQEFAADALAARVVGSHALAEGLKEIHRATAAFAVFWQNEYLPALRYQLRPPLAVGFSRFMLQDRIAGLMESALQEELTTAKVDPYGTHPPLPERCAALARLDATEGLDDTRVSITLLHGLAELERDLVGITVGPKRNEARPVGWDEIPKLVWYPKFRDEVRRQAEALREATVVDAAYMSREPQAIADKLRFEPDYLPDIEQRCADARNLIAAALIVALVDAGWRMKGDPGGPITCIREEFWSRSAKGEIVEPSEVVGMFKSGELSPQAWRERCDRLGISALRLALPMPASAPAS